MEKYLARSLCSRRLIQLRCSSNRAAVTHEYFPAPTIHQTITGRKRFYKNVTVDMVPPNEHEFFLNLMGKDPQSWNKPLYRIQLDGKTLKTPGRNPLHFPSLSLAGAIAAEWDKQCEKRGIQPVTMPLMSLASTAIDQAAVEPNISKETCMKYLPTDSALFFASNEDRILLRKQNEYFKPVIRWFKRNFNIELATTQEFTGKLNHSPESVSKIRSMIDTLDPFTLTCLQSATSELKSLVLALSFVTRHSSLEQATTFARVEEEFQVEIWGEVEGGHDMDRLNCAVRLSSIDLFLGLFHDAESLDILVNKWKKL